jgi:hypothetical protein
MWRKQHARTSTPLLLSGTARCFGSGAGRRCPKNEARTRRLKMHLRALDRGKEWVTKSALRPKNAPSPAGHFGRRADLATGRAPVPSP